jgi:hypothetical protein
VRHFQRLKRGLSAERVGGLVHQGRGQPSPRRALALRQQVSQFIRTAYAGFNDCVAVSTTFSWRSNM